MADQQLQDSQQQQQDGGADSMTLQGVVGFSGQVIGGLVLHPDDEHVIYPLGSTIVVKHLINNTQHFLQKDGHDRPVSCLALSPSGKFLASGQVTHMGFPAVVVIWNLETCEAVHKLKLHKGKVQDLAFSSNESYLATLGGEDDNRVVIWDVQTGEGICGAECANKQAFTVRFFNNDEYRLVTGGVYNLRTWEIDRKNRKIKPTDCQLGQLKRHVVSMYIDANDDYLYCGTSTGDVMRVSLSTNTFKELGPKKERFSQGVKCLTKTAKGNLLVGAGDGTIAVLHRDTMKIIRRLKLNGGVTSIQLNAAGDHFFVSTLECNIYLVHLQSMEYELRTTCHSDVIRDVVFPTNYSELFATCSRSDIRVWNAATRSELLRIRVPNLDCLCIAFSPDGKAIISGWNDGKIRAFYPQSGTLKYVIHDAHMKGVTAITVTKDSQRIISGGGDGQVRVWAIEKHTQKMLASMKEHKGPVNCIHLNEDDTECCSASDDGSCIIWDLERYIRANCIFASTQFKACQYHPDQSQLLTTGSDRKITYWDVVDANPIRIIDGSATAEMHTLAFAEDGESFVSGGADKLIKVWSYDEGFCYFRGMGHSGSITKVVVAPNQKFIVSVGEEGAIFIWKMPEVPISPQDLAEQAAAAASNDVETDNVGDEGGAKQDRSSNTKQQDSSDVTGLKTDVAQPDALASMEGQAV